MNMASLTITVLLCITILIVPRRSILLFFIAGACLIPMDQRIDVIGLDFTTLRLCVFAGLLRLFIRGEMRPIQANGIDKLFIAWVIFGSVVYVLQWQTSDAMVNRSGYLFDGLGLYLLSRLALRSWEDVVYAIKYFAFFAIISAPFFIIERIQQRSPYSILGHSVASFHRGRFRCSGPFSHYIIMGSFWVSVLPWFYACIMAGLSKAFYGVAIAAAILCVILSGSSTPLMTGTYIVLLLFLYRYRHYGKQIAAGIAILLIGLHFVMKAPVWHLMARFSFFGGSTGWHRYHLFDQFVNRVPEWFLLGTRSTEHWGAGLEDVTNQYVLEGVRGGFITLCLFVALNVMCAVTSWKAAVEYRNKKLSWLCWGVCVSILGHSLSFWGISYFGQIIMPLYLTFAMGAFVKERLDNQLMVNKL